MQTPKKKYRRRLNLYITFQTEHYKITNYEESTLVKRKRKRQMLQSIHAAFFNRCSDCNYLSFSSELTVSSDIFPHSGKKNICQEITLRGFPGTLVQAADEPSASWKTGCCPCLFCSSSPYFIWFCKFRPCNMEHELLRHEMV